jgi:hypothetical protein
MLLLASTTSWWQSFPWAAVGAAVGLITLALGGLKLAMTWGAIKERVAEHGREIEKLRGKADGVPDAVDHEVTSKSKFLEGAVKALAHKLGQLYKATRALKRQHDQILKRCQDEHGMLPEPQQDPIDDVLSAPPDVELEEGGSDDAQ